MANNLKKFATAADYSAATLNYPAVSWIVSGDTVEYDLSGSTPIPNDKLIYMQDYPSGASLEIDLPARYDMGNEITSMTVNGVAVEASATTYTMPSGVALTLVVGISGETFDLNLLDSVGYQPLDSDATMGDILIPSNITEVTYTDFDLHPHKIVVNNSTPPTVSQSFSSVNDSLLEVYVPDDALTEYSETEGWSEINRRNKLFPISDYQGNLPV